MKLREKEVVCSLHSNSRDVLTSSLLHMFVKHTIHRFPFTSNIGRVNSRMNKKISNILKKCKSLSKLGRSSSFRSMRCNSTRDYQVLPSASADGREVGATVVFVGSSRRCYTISAKHLSHPLINALIDRSKNDDDDDEKISVKCEVVLFDHLLWMLENTNPEEVAADGSLEELAQLYAS